MICSTDAASPNGIEERGFVGVVISNAPKQAPTGDFRSILSVIPESAAAEAGIRPGDYILSVDGQSTAGMKSYAELLHALQGAPGTRIRLELKRIEGGRIETLTITRGKQLFSVDFPK